jgi:acyl carrier protein
MILKRKSRTASKARSGQCCLIKKYGSRTSEEKHMYEQIIEIVAKQFKLDKSVLSRETSILKDIGADSLDLVDLLMKLEDTYNVKIKDADLEKIKTIGDIENYFKR